MRSDFIGLNSLYKDEISNNMNTYVPNEIRLRVAARCKDINDARVVGNEVEALYTNGPYGGGGATKAIKDIVSIASIFADVKDFKITVDYLEVK